MRRRWGCAQYAAGCIGLLLGATLTIAIEIFLAAALFDQFSQGMKERAENGPSQHAYDSMCSNKKALEKDPSLKRACDGMLVEMEAAAKRRAASTSTGHSK